MTDYEPGTPIAEPQQQPQLMEEETELQLDEPLLPEVDPMRLLNDPSYNPTMHEGQGPLMQHEPFLLFYVRDIDMRCWSDLIMFNVLKFFNLLEQLILKYLYLDLKMMT